jgi:hypothetical protein
MAKSRLVKVIAFEMDDGDAEEDDDDEKDKIGRFDTTDSEAYEKDHDEKSVARYPGGTLARFPALTTLLYSLFWWL